MAQSVRQKIDVPRKHSTVALQSHPSPFPELNVPPFIIANGYYASGIHLDPDNISITGADNVPIPGEIKKQSPYWVVVFPGATLGAHNPYTLVIMDVGGKHLEGAAPYEFNIAIPVVAAAAHADRPRDLIISNPVGNQTVCQNFTSAGTTDSTATVVGTLTNGTNTVTANTVQDGPQWIIQFANAPVGTYTLTVVASPSFSSQGPITVVANPPGQGGGGGRQGGFPPP